MTTPAPSVGLRRRLLPFTGLVPMLLMVPVLAFNLYAAAIVLAPADRAHGRARDGVRGTAGRGSRGWGGAR